MGFVGGDLIFEGGARPHQRHVATQHVVELGNLVNGVASVEFSALGDSRVVLHLEQNTVGLVFVGQQLGLDLVGVDNHRAQFVALEDSAFASDSTLLVEHRTAILMFDGDSSEKDDWGGENE